jgi:putative PIN family toxin of toxin-antitoxin system
MANPRVVADTNVLVAAVIAPAGVCGRLLTAALDGRWTIVASPLLLAELREVLQRPKFRRWISADEASQFTASIKQLVEIHADPPNPPAVTADPDDDYLVALAVASEVSAIVSAILTSPQRPHNHS